MLLITLYFYTNASNFLAWFFHAHQPSRIKYVRPHRIATINRTNQGIKHLSTQKANWPITPPNPMRTDRKKYPEKSSIKRTIMWKLTVISSCLMHIVLHLSLAAWRPGPQRPWWHRLRHPWAQATPQRAGLGTGSPTMGRTSCSASTRTSTKQMLAKACFLMGSGSMLQTLLCANGSSPCMSDTPKQWDWCLVASILACS